MKATRLGESVLLALALCAVGCGRQPQLAAGNRKLVESLRTAVSAHNTAWLDENAKRVESQHTKGALSDDEFKALNQIIEVARTGDWSGAEKRLIKLAKAQRVTEEDIRRLQNERAAPKKRPLDRRSSTSGT